MKPPKKNHVLMAFDYKGKTYSAQANLGDPRVFEKMALVAKNTYKKLRR